ncbi:MAG: hypothetical protein ABEJ70_08590 [Halobacteriaceae archaeon]
MDRPSRDALAGAVLGSGAVLAYLAAVGYRVDPLLTAPASGSVLSLVATLAVLGAATALSLRGDVRLAVAGLLVWLPMAALFPLFGRGPDGHATVLEPFADLLVVTVVFCVAASAEFALRRPDRVSWLFTPGAVWRSTTAGAVTVLVVLGTRTALGFSWGLQTLFGVAFVGWTAAGTALLGFVVTLLALRARLLSPIAVAVGLFAVATGLTLEYLADLAATGAAMGVAFTPVTGYAVGWFAVLALALLAGGAEYALRARLGVGPPPGP